MTPLQIAKGLQQPEMLHDAIDTLNGLIAAEAKKIERQQLRLDDPDLPRGPFPVRMKIIAHETTAFHLSMAVNALASLEQGEKKERKAA